MKSLFQISLLLIITAAFFATGCDQDRCTRVEEYTEFQPVFKRIDEMRIPTQYTYATSLSSPGKIFYYKGYLLVNEMHKGIHVIDNSNPEAPQNLGFIEIPGNLDMAVNNDILYADSYLYLVAIDITNPTAPVEVNRVNDVFQSFYSFNEQLGYLVEYVPTSVTRTIDCSDPNWGRQTFFVDDVFMASAEFDVSGGLRDFSNTAISSNVVTGGSMARFTVANDYLYTIDGAEIKIFDVKQPSPSLKNEIALTWGIETLFPLAGSLFIGSNSGLIIYDITNPESPQYLSTFTHATACDPVVVEGETAYVTLRDGNQCQGFVNQLDVVNVSNLTNPSLIKSYAMSNPHGLSVFEKTLYVCEGAFGLKSFDVSNPNDVSDHLLDTQTGFFAYDVIVLPPGNHVMVVGKDGLYQFDASDKNDLKQLSVINIGN
ncbi:MAG TPA: hypothetical protein VMZ69_07830 [Saprospiraceae bacterium]|nr:hypothetical protein [Saprospiraceae bacterium]